VETPSHQQLKNKESQILLSDCALFHTDVDDNRDGNLKGSGQDKVGNTSKRKEPVWPDQPGKNDDNPSKNDDT